MDTAMLMHAARIVNILVIAPYVMWRGIQLRSELLVGMASVTFFANAYIVTTGTPVLGHLQTMRAFATAYVGPVAMYVGTMHRDAPLFALGVALMVVNGSLFLLAYKPDAGTT